MYRELFWLVAVPILCGCNDPKSPRIIVTSPVQDVRRTEEIPIVAGPRPLRIGNARFVKIHEFHRGSFNEQWICIESIMEKTRRMNSGGFGFDLHTTYTRIPDRSRTCGIRQLGLRRNSWSTGFSLPFWRARQATACTPTTGEHRTLIHRANLPDFICIFLNRTIAGEPAAGCCIQNTHAIPVVLILIRFVDFLLDIYVTA